MDNRTLKEKLVEILELTPAKQPVERQAERLIQAVKDHLFQDWPEKKLGGLDISEEYSNSGHNTANDLCRKHVEEKLTE